MRVHIRYGLNFGLAKSWLLVYRHRLQEKNKYRAIKAVFGEIELCWTRLEATLFSDTEAAENPPQQILRRKLSSNFRQCVLRLTQFFRR